MRVCMYIIPCFAKNGNLSFYPLKNNNLPDFGIEKCKIQGYN